MNTEYFEQLPETDQNRIKDLYQNESAELAALRRAAALAEETTTNALKPDAANLKIEINELVWRNAAQNITLQQAEDIALPFWQAIMETHE